MLRALTRAARSGVGTTRVVGGGNAAVPLSLAQRYLGSVSNPPSLLRRPACRGSAPVGCGNVLNSGSKPQHAPGVAVLCLCVIWGFIARLMSIMTGRAAPVVTSPPAPNTPSPVAPCHWVLRHFSLAVAESREPSTPLPHIRSRLSGTYLADRVAHTPACPARLPLFPEGRSDGRRCVAHHCERQSSEGGHSVHHKHHAATPRRPVRRPPERPHPVTFDMSSH